ncbi:MAG: SHOCT domain-containing protein, partial [Luteolibacter sp.]
LFEYELESDSLVLKQKQGAERLQTRIKYSTLLPDPDHRASSERKLLYFGIFLVLLAFPFGFTATTIPDEVVRIFFTMLTIVTLIGAAVFIRRFMTSRFDVVTYFYRNGTFAFNVWRNVPDEASFTEFVSKLGKLIKDEHPSTDHAGSTTACLSLEIDRLGGLREKGLLTDEEFARAKSSLLEQLEQGGRVIGFHQG